VHRFRRDDRAQHERVAEAIALSQTQGFRLWLGAARAFRGAARAASGAGAEALTEVLDGLALAAGGGSPASAPGLLGLLAETHAAAGQRAEALANVETALAVAAQTGGHFFDAELHRLKGEILLAAQPGIAAEAEALFCRALEIARAQEARSFELRAATSLARLLRAQGRANEAHAVLAPVYAWFTEGFDTRDLIDAKALLDELESRLAT